MKEQKALQQVRLPDQVIDILGGEVTGDYLSQLKQLEKEGFTACESMYYEAYQLSIQQ